MICLAFTEFFSDIESETFESICRSVLESLNSDHHYIRQFSRSALLKLLRTSKKKFKQKQLIELKREDFLKERKSLAHFVGRRFLRDKEFEARPFYKTNLGFYGFYKTVVVKSSNSLQLLSKETTLLAYFSEKNFCLEMLEMMTLDMALIFEN